MNNTWASNIGKLHRTRSSYNRTIVEGGVKHRTNNRTYDPSNEKTNSVDFARTAQADLVDTLRRGHNVGFTRDGSYLA